MDRETYCESCLQDEHRVETTQACRCHCHPAGQAVGKPGGKTRKNRSGKARRNLVAFLLIRDGDQCHWCEVTFDDDWPPTIDHIVPRSLGGRNDRTNSVLSCSWCNEKRGQKSPEEFRAWLVKHGPFPVELRRNHWKTHRRGTRQPSQQ